MADTLEQFFGETRLKILRFFFRNPGQYFNSQEIGYRVQLTTSPSGELERLFKIKFLKRKKKNRDKIYYSLNKDFYFYPEFRDLILKSSPTLFKKVLGAARGLGSVKLLLISGVLTNQENSRVDLLVVGDYIIKSKFEKFLRKLEAEVGQELTYAVIKSSDFRYRQSMFDNFIKEVLQKPHVKLINRMGL